MGLLCVGGHPLEPVRLIGHRRVLCACGAFSATDPGSQEDYRDVAAAHADAGGQEPEPTPAGPATPPAASGGSLPASEPEPAAEPVQKWTPAQLDAPAELPDPPAAAAIAGPEPEPPARRGDVMSWLADG